MNELLEWSAENENFRFIPFFESDEMISEFEYETGRINSESLKKHLGDFNNKKYFLIGPPAMVDSFKDILLNQNVSEENIMTEKFK